MREIGFSTGALAYADFRRGIRILVNKGIGAVELSALRQRELGPLIDSLDAIDLSSFAYVSVHAPSQLEDATEAQTVNLMTTITRRGWPIESMEGCKSFELSWNRYAAYLVTEELVGSNGSYQDEAYTGKLLRVYTKSHFLDHLARDTGGHLEPLRHYKLICLSHLIDVASYAPPEIHVIDSAPPPATPIQ